MKKILALALVLSLAFCGVSAAASTAENKASGTDFNSDVPTVSIYGHSGTNTIVPIKVSSDGTIATSTAGGAVDQGTGGSSAWKVTGTGGTFPVTGTLTDSITSATLITKTIDFSASETAQAIWTPTSGKKFVITDMVISCSAAGTITVFDSTNTTATRIVKGYFAANGGLSQPYSKPRESSTANNVLKYTTGSGIAGSITVQGYEI